MNVIILLIIVSLSVALVFLVLFIWSVSKGQFDDDYTPALRILDDNTLNQKSNE